MSQSSKVYIFYTSFSSQFSEETWKKYLSIFPENIISEILKYRGWQDRQTRLLGKLMLLKALKIVAPNPMQMLSQIKFNEFKRPYINNDFDFNISHSGEYIVLAFSQNAKVGIDIEQNRQIDITILKNYLTEEEWHKLQNSKNQIDLFFDFWTKKESIIKADGRGLFVTLKNIKLHDNFGILDEKKWYLHQLAIAKNYQCVLACDQKNITVFSQSFKLEHGFDFTEKHLKYTD